MNQRSRLSASSLRLVLGSHLQGGEIGSLSQSILLLGGRVGPPLVRQEPLRQDACRLLVVPAINIAQPGVVWLILQSSVLCLPVRYSHP